ncbi:MAG: PIN domain-containing protein [Gemmatimonadota bacterium]|nr:PIN domain-containing protein [Gemmatimonadota bacterium]
MAKIIRVYWDACSWIAYINQEKNIPLAGGRVENRFAMCDEVLKSAENGKLEIVTSAFTLAEVCKSPEVRDSPIDHLPSFFERSYILLVPVDMAIARRAQSIQTSGVFNLKPPDAVHLASAQRAAVRELHTFDSRVLDLDGQLAGSDGEQIKICKPTEGTPIGPLFEENEV